MRQNPFPDDPTRAQQPTDVLPKRMEDLPPKQVQQQIPLASAETSPSVDSAETRQEEARTVRYAIGKLNDFLQWFIAVLEVTLAVRFLLKLIGADPSNLFAGFLYALTDIILFPFSGIVQPTRWQPAHAVPGVTYPAFEWSTLIAMLIYWLIFWAIRRFLRILITGPEEPAS
ncbi:MAG: YggT family protein [Chloroflexi bacterium]|nr:YggT family protein [Chloroflexota bacterium]